MGAARCGKPCEGVLVRLPTLLGLVLIVGAARAAAAADTLRCGGALISVGMVASQVAARCGEPQTKHLEDVPVRVRRANGKTAAGGITRVERWTYERDYGQFPALLTFEQGKLKTIELLTER
jgi:hypothetical protein